jgi:rhodanese-related sulfurtransferase
MEITPEELSTKIKRGEKLVLIDVREPEEYDICRIEGAKLIPMREFPAHVHELNPKDSIVLYCHHGVRSAQVTLWLRGRGFEKAENLQGGIEAWAELIDPEMERY